MFAYRPEEYLENSTEMHKGCLECRLNGGNWKKILWQDVFVEGQWIFETMSVEARQFKLACFQENAGHQHSSRLGVVFWADMGSLIF